MGQRMHNMCATLFDHSIVVMPNAMPKATSDLEELVDGFNVHSLLCIGIRQFGLGSIPGIAMVWVVELEHTHAVSKSSKT